MAWIESHQSLPTHRKTLAAADLLDMQPVHVVGHLTAFWLWALDNAPEGGLSGVSARTISRAAQWERDPQELVSALLQAGFLDKDDEGELSIHNWHRYAGKLIERREANAERMREKRQPARNTCDERAQHVQDTCAARAPATVPNRTLPDLTVPDHETTTPPSAGESAQPIAPAFDEDTDAFKLSAHLRARIRENDPKAKVPNATPSALSRWSKDMDLLLRVDGREPDEVRRVIDWCQTDSFWRGNILCPATLRKQFTKLLMRASAPARASPVPSAYPRPVTTKQEAEDDEWDRQFAAKVERDKAAALSRAAN